MLTNSEKADLQRVWYESMPHSTCQTEVEVLFAREVQKQGMDYEAAAEYGINQLKLNRNSLNAAYNQLQKTIGLEYI